MSKKNYLRISTENYYIDSNQGLEFFVRRKDKAISCAYIYEACDCSKNKKWFKNEAKFYSQHGLEY